MLIHHTQDLQAFLYITHKTSKQSYTLHTRPPSIPIHYTQGHPSILIHYTQDLRLQAIDLQRNLIHYTQDLIHQAILYITHKTSKHSYTLHTRPIQAFLYITHKTSKQSYTLHTRIPPSILLYITHKTSNNLLHYTQESSTYTPDFQAI